MRNANRNVCFPQLGLIGRLGNALFELASTTGVARSMGVEPRFNADWTHRDFFSVPDEYFTEDFSGCIESWKTPHVAHIDERARIYLQDWHLFNDVLDDIIEWLAPSPLATKMLNEDPGYLEFIALPRPILCVHVRRGDNAPGGDPLTPDKYLYHPMPTLSYYNTAIDRFDPPAGSGLKPPSVAVFGDDPEWNVENIDADFYYMGTPRPKEHEADFLSAPVMDWIDFQMLTLGDFHVLSNSTFGIMAAMLARTQQAVIPWPIYGPRLNYIDVELLVYPTWTRLPNGRS